MDQLPEEETFNASVVQPEPLGEVPNQKQTQQQAPATLSPASHPRTLIIVIIVIILIGGGVLGGLPLLAAQALQKQVDTVDRVTAQLLTLNQTMLTLESSLTDNALTVVDDHSSYAQRLVAYKKVQDGETEWLKQEDKAVTLINQQVANFQGNSLTALYSKYRQPMETVSAALKVNAQAATRAQSLNKEETASILAILQIVADIQLAGEVFAEKDLNQASGKAEPLKKYASADFAFPDESLIKGKDAKSSDAITQGKQFLADSYNLVQALKQGNNDQANQLAQNINQRAPGVDSALLAALNYQNPDWLTINKDEKASLDSYISTLKGVSGIHFAEHRTVAYETLSALAIARNTDQTYPQTTDFESMKKILKLDYGSNDYLRYSSHSKDSFHLEYMDDGSNQWQVVELKSSQPVTPAVTPPQIPQVQ